MISSLSVRRSVLATALAFAWFSTRGASQSVWVQKAPTPSLRAAAAAAILNGTLHVVGGGDGGACSYLTTHEVYDPETNTWSARRPLSQGRGGFGAAVLNVGGKDLLYVVGGSTGCSSRTATVEAYDPDTDTWSFRKPMPHGARSVMGVAVIDNLLYVAGGLVSDTAGVTNLLEIYDPVTDTWLPDAPSMTHPRYAMAAAAIDGIFYVAGGGDSTGPLAFLEAYDPGTRKWTDKSPLNVPRGFTSGIASNGRFWVVGGDARPVEPVQSSIEIYDPLTDVWTFGPALPAPRAYVQPAALQDTIYVAGGWDGTRIVNTNFALVEPPTASLTATPSPAACGQPVNFDASGSQPGSAPISRYDWTFGDGATQLSGGSRQVHVYSRFGTYQASVTVTDTNALSSTAAVAVNVNEGNHPPQAYPGGPYAVDSGKPVTFDGTASWDPDAACGDSIVGYAWTSDGVQLSGATPTLNTVGLTAGIHGVTLTVTDSLGAAATASTTLTVRPVLTSISVDPSTMTLNVASHQQFTATGHFSDGSMRTLPSTVLGSPTLQAWWVHFSAGLPWGVCSTPPSSNTWLSQGLRNNNGTIQERWGTLLVKGWMTSDNVDLSIQCADLSSPVAPGSISASWTGTRYVGSFTFAGARGALQITGWSTQADMPTRRHGFGAAAVNGTIYAVGGTDGGSVLGTVEAYDTNTNQWTSAAPMPTPREGAGVVALGGVVYAIGGRTADGAASSLVETYAAATNTWTTLPQAESMPTARAHLAAVTDGTFVYAIGGDTAPGNTGQVATVERYDPVLHEWKTLMPMPVAGNFIAAGVLGQTIVVVGSGGPSARTDVYDIDADAWHAGVPMPAARTQMAAGVANGGLWVVGGSIDVLGPFDTWVYYPQGNGQAERWTGSGAIPTPRVDFAAAVVGDVLYAIGGTAPFATTSLSKTDALSTVPYGDWNPGVAFDAGDLVPIARWQSSNPQVATIDQTGNATALLPGTTRIIASAAGIQCDADCGALTVDRLSSEVTLRSSPNPSQGGQTVTFTATVTGKQGFAVPTGTVTFAIDGSDVTTTAVDANGVATYATNALRDGVRNVMAKYGGDTIFKPAAAITSQTVNGPPRCGDAEASPQMLWPPNHRMVPVAIQNVTDPDGDPIRLTVDGIFQDEPVVGLGSGDTGPDGAGVGTATPSVRAERDGSPHGNGRAYHIFFTASDGRGGSCSGEVRVGVPHDASSLPPTDGSALFNSTTGQRRQP